jgi:hypothetical protein
MNNDNDENSETEKHPLRPIWENVYVKSGLLAISIGVLLFFVGIILYRMLASDYQISLADTILIVLLLLLSSGVLHDLLEISVSQKGFFAKFDKRVNKVEQNVTEVEQKVKQNVTSLQREVAKHVLTKGELLQLRRLIVDENYVGVTYSLFLLQEMIRLCQHEFVVETYHNSTWEMKDKYETSTQQYNLKEFYHVTDEGRKYFDIMEEYGVISMPQKTEETQ